MNRFQHNDDASLPPAERWLDEFSTRSGSAQEYGLSTLARYHDSAIPDQISDRLFEQGCGGVNFYSNDNSFLPRKVVAKAPGYEYADLPPRSLHYLRVSRRRSIDILFARVNAKVFDSTHPAYIRAIGRIGEDRDGERLLAMLRSLPPARWVSLSEAYYPYYCNVQLKRAIIHALGSLRYAAAAHDVFHEWCGLDRHSFEYECLRAMILMRQPRDAIPELQANLLKLCPHVALAHDATNDDVRILRQRLRYMKHAICSIVYECIEQLSDQSIQSLLSMPTHLDVQVLFKHNLEDSFYDRNMVGIDRRCKPIAITVDMTPLHQILQLRA